MYATIRFAAPTDSVMSVPRSAVLATGERNLVFVRRADGRFAPHLVTLGAETEDRVEIMRGLTLGDTVVASGTFLVDAESNLGSMLGGMGNMPGMDMTAPAANESAGPVRPGGAQDSHPGMQMEE
jgi:Cu(I)/Ag(I) efflux system membrane fusion protein